MKLVSHRGNIHGPCPSCENHPEYIDDAIGHGFICEIDLWYMRNTFYLGHDISDNIIPISFHWFVDRRKSLIIHTKNINAALKMRDTRMKFEYFSHQDDDFVITSLGNVWSKDFISSFSDVKHNANKIIIVNPNLRRYPSLYNDIGICSDYIDSVRKSAKARGLLSDDNKI